jgi:hypothetical protein
MPCPLKFWFRAAVLRDEVGLEASPLRATYKKWEDGVLFLHSYLIEAVASVATTLHDVLTGTFVHQAHI